MEIQTKVITIVSEAANVEAGNIKAETKQLEVYYILNGNKSNVFELSLKKVFLTIEYKSIHFTIQDSCKKAILIST